MKPNICINWRLFCFHFGDFWKFKSLRGNQGLNLWNTGALKAKNPFPQHKIISGWNLDNGKHQVVSTKKFNNYKTRCKLIVWGEGEGTDRILFYGIYLFFVGIRSSIWECLESEDNQ